MSKKEALVNSALEIRKDLINCHPMYHVFSN